MPTASKWSPRPHRSLPAETGFDSWLNRSLRASYGEAMDEPVPAELLDLIRGNARSK